VSRPALTLSLQFADASHRALLPRHKVARWLRAALDAPAQLTVRIVDADEGRALNHGYRRKGYATNVLTFVYRDTPPYEGDLALCAPVVTREAHEQRKSVAGHYAHLVVHGTLHLQGYDHQRAADADAMETRESQIVVKLGYPDPYTAPGRTGKRGKSLRAA